MNTLTTLINEFESLTNFGWLFFSDKLSPMMEPFVFYTWKSAIFCANLAIFCIHSHSIRNKFILDQTNMPIELNWIGSDFLKVSRRCALALLSIVQRVTRIISKVWGDTSELLHALVSLAWLYWYNNSEPGGPKLTCRLS